MDRLMAFFQGDLSDSAYTDNQVIDSLLACQHELRRAHLDLPPPPPDASEYPTRPFGLFVPASVEQQIGRPILESPSEVLRGQRSTVRHGSRMSISIPPDGGPVIVESLDIPTTSGPRLPSVGSRDKNTPRQGNPMMTANQTAQERRAAFAKTHSTKRLPNGIAETAVDSSTSNGKNVGEVGQTVGLRQKSVGVQKPAGKDREVTDSAAPQTYSVSVKL